MSRIPDGSVVGLLLHDDHVQFAEKGIDRQAAHVERGRDGAWHQVRLKGLLGR